jgi:hypothetical protein
MMRRRSVLSSDLEVCSMTSPLTARQAGIASIIAAILILCSQISQVGLPLVFPESFWIATQSLRMGLALAAMFALLVALTGLYAREAHATGRLALIGYLTAFLGTLLVAGDWWYEAIIGPGLRAEAPELLATAPTGLILIGAAITTITFGVGWLLFGLASVRAGVLPRSGTLLMTVGGVVGILALIAPFQVPLGAAVGWLGIWLVGTAGQQDQSHGVPSAAASRPASL